MEAWGQQQNAEHIIMLADGGAEFSKATGLNFDTGAFGGIRALRYSMLVENGIVTQLNVEPPKEFGVSSAETMLAQL